MSAETTPFVDDVVFDGQAQVSGISVTVTVRLEPDAQYRDMYELGESVGARAASMLAQVQQASAQAVPF